MSPQRRVEVMRRFVSVSLLRGRDLGEHIRMRAHRALAEDDQAPREDVRAFYRDADRNLLIAAAEIVVGPETDALAAVHVHRIVQHLARTLRAVILDDRG